MAKAGDILLSAFCILAFAAALVKCHEPDTFKIEGSVYCDPCRVEFQTSLSTPIKGAKVRLECRHAETRQIAYSLDGVTDETGHYVLHAKGDHGEEMCEVMAVESSSAECSEQFGNFERARVVLSSNSGITGTDRYVNPLGFKTKKPADGCKSVLDLLGLGPGV